MVRYIDHHHHTEKHLIQNLLNCLTKLKKQIKICISDGRLQRKYTERNVRNRKYYTRTNILSSHYFHKLIHLPTRERNKCSTPLNNIYNNIPDSNNSSTSSVLKFLAQSDHYPVFTIIKNNEPPKHKRII